MRRLFVFILGNKLICLKKLFSSAIAIFLTFHSFSQDKVRAALDTIQQFYPQEKIYLLYNKQEYIAGESIWFSAFVFSGYDVSKISTNLFVELYGADKKLLARKQLPLFNGQTAGEIPLQAKLDEGVYYIHAYTQWMLNFPASQYVHQLLIYNPKSANRLQQKELAWKTETFIEGGKLIDGLPAKVAVRLSSPSTLPSHWSGYITETGSNEKLASFQNLDPNVGVVGFTPNGDRQYQLTVEDDKGSKQLMTLPKTTADGVQLKADNLLDSIVYTITFKNVSSSGFRLIGTMNDEMMYEASIKKSVTVLRKSISTSALDNGILRLSLFDANDNLVAERLCFVKPTALEIKTPALSTTQFNASARSLNKLEFLSDTTENPYSILVMDASLNDPMGKENFPGFLWFSSDVVSPVEHPAQYFTDPDIAKANALDAILITESLKNFSWDKILKGNYQPLKYLPDNYISYKGTVFHNKKLVPNEDVNLIFSFPDSSSQFMQVKTDSTGSFTMHNLFFYDSAKVFYQLNSKKNSAKDITIQFETLNRSVGPFFDFPPIAYDLVPRQANDKLPEVVNRSLKVLANEQEIDNRYKIMKEVTVRTKRVKTPKEKLNEELSSSLFQSFNETVFDFVNEDQHAGGYTNILQWLEGQVAGLRIDFRDGAYVPIIRGTQVNVYVDEMQVDPQFINGYSVSEIAMVKVIKGFFVGAFGGGSGSGFGLGSGGGSGGAICIYTKKPGMRTVNSQPSLNSNKLKGYDKWKDYPSINYSDNFISEIKTDTRDVLFWNPFTVSANEKMKVPIQFYNNDLAKEFRIIIIGMTPEGELVYYNGILK
jgi:hypothetical protein